MILFNVTSRDFKVTEAMWEAIDKHVQQLETYFDRVNRCEVVISSPHHHQNKGRIYHIRVMLDVPGQNIIISREPEKNGAHEDFYVALRDAFRASARKLQDHVKRLRGDVKNHEMSRRDAAV